MISVVFRFYLRFEGTRRGMVGSEDKNRPAASFGPIVRVFFHTSIVLILIGKVLSTVLKAQGGLG